MSNDDVYVLCDVRSIRLAESFLSAFAPVREPCADEYPFPYLSDDPRETFATPEPLLQRLEENADQSYSLYWRAKVGDGHRIAMLFFTSDGAMIAGLSVWPLAIVEAMEQLRHVVSGRFGYVDGGGSPPPDSGADFIDLCRSADLPCLVDGELHLPPDASRDSS